MVVPQTFGGTFGPGAADDFAELPDFLTGIAVLGRFKPGAVKLNVTVDMPLHTGIFMPFKEECAGQHIIGIIHHFMRQDVLNHHQVKCLESLGQPVGVRFTVEHRGTGDERSADRIGLAGMNRLKDCGIRTGAFREEHLVERLLFTDFLFPGLTHGVLALALGRVKTHTDTLHAGTLSDNEAALAVNRTGKDVEDADERIHIGVIAVTGGVPSVVSHTALREEVVGELNNISGRNTGDRCGLFRREFHHLRCEDRVAGLHFDLVTHRIGNHTREVEIGLGGRILIETGKLAGIIHLHALETDFTGNTVTNRVVVVAAARAQHGFGHRHLISSDQIAGVGVLRKEVKVSKIIGNRNIEHCLNQSRVGTRADRQPLGAGERSFGHARVNKHHAGALFGTCAGHHAVYTDGAVERAADHEQEVAVFVVGLELTGTVKTFTKNGTAPHDGGGVAR